MTLSETISFPAFSKLVEQARAGLSNTSQDLKLPPEFLQKSLLKGTQFSNNS